MGLLCGMNFGFCIIKGGFEWGYFDMFVGFEEGFFGVGVYVQIGQDNLFDCVGDFFGWEIGVGV